MFADEKVNDICVRNDSLYGQFKLYFLLKIHFSISYSIQSIDDLCSSLFSAYKEKTHGYSFDNVNLYEMKDENETTPLALEIYKLHCSCHLLLWKYNLHKYWYTIDPFILINCSLQLHPFIVQLKVTLDTG